MNNKCEGIVLRQSDYRDSDMILSVFSKENGKMSFLARGLKKAKSKNASSCSLGCCSVFYYNDNGKDGMQSLKTAERKKMFHRIYDDLITQTCAQMICECMDKMAQEKNEELYQLLYQSLSYLNEKKDAMVVLGLFLSHCLKYSGISPNVNECVKCHSQKGIASISLKDGGFLCVRCMDPLYHKRYGENELYTFRLLQKAGLNDIDVLCEHVKCTYEDISILLSFLEEYSGIYLKSATFLKQITEM